MDDFSGAIYTDNTGMQFRQRKSDGSVFTYRPSTDELVFLCPTNEWASVAKLLGFELHEPDQITKTNPKRKERA